MAEEFARDVDLDREQLAREDALYLVRGPPVDPVLDLVMLLQSIRATDPDAHHILRRPGLFDALCAAEADLLGRDPADVRHEREEERPEGPRRYMSFRGWCRARGVAIEDEGELGSHWPGREDKDHE